MAADIDYRIHYNERQWSVKDFWSCALGDEIADRLQTLTKELLAIFIEKTDRNTLSAPSCK